MLRVNYYCRYPKVRGHTISVGAVLVKVGVTLVVAVLRKDLSHAGTSAKWDLR